MLALCACFIQRLSTSGISYHHLAPHVFFFIIYRNMCTIRASPRNADICTTCMYRKYRPRILWRHSPVPWECAKHFRHLWSPWEQIDWCAMEGETRTGGWYTSGGITLPNKPFSCLSACKPLSPIILFHCIFVPVVPPFHWVLLSASFGSLKCVFVQFVAPPPPGCKQAYSWRDVKSSALL